MKIELSDIRIDGGTQARAKIDEAAVADYADALTEGETLPQITVFFDGTEYWLADGFHRFHANKRIAAVTIEAKVLNGDRRAAVLYSVGANHDHGLRRTTADKQKAVETLLNDFEWSKWSNVKIAEACAVNDKTVAARRAAIIGISDDTKRTVERNGTVYEQKIKAPAKSEPAKLPEPEHEATVESEPKVVEEAPSALDPRVADLEEELEAYKEANEALQTQNDKLCALVDPESDAAKMIDDLQKRLVRCQTTLRSAELTRDNYMRENAELKREVKSLRKRLPA